jgi:hypothetical protein
VINSPTGKGVLTVMRQPIPMIEDAKALWKTRPEQY